MGLFSSLGKSVRNAIKSASSGSSGNSSSSSRSSGSSSRNPITGQSINNAITGGLQGLADYRNNKIMDTDWQAKIDSATTQADKDYYNDIRNQKLALMGKNDPNGAPSWLQTQPLGAEQYQQVADASQTQDYDIQKQMDALAEARTQSQIAGLTKAKESALAGLDTRKSSIEPYYYNQKNQAAAQSDVGAMNFAQYMASRGVQGNAAAMPEMYRNAGLQSQIGALDQQQASEMSAIERDRTNIENNYLSDVESAKADIQAQRLQDYVTQMNADRDYQTSLNTAQQKQTTDSQKLYSDNIKAYYNDYQAEIDNLRSQGYPDDSYEIKALMVARNDKIKEQEKLQAEQAQQDFLNGIKQAQLNNDTSRTNYTTNKPYYKPTTTKTAKSPTFSQQMNNLDDLYANGYYTKKQYESAVNSLAKQYGY